ncbi:TPA: hypothetical protein JLE07_004423 [Escherichia coli]|nr:hypothetical protein [Escherichia coli]
MQPPDQEEKRSMNNLMVIDGIEVRRDAYPQGELKVSRISEAISGANGEYSHQLLAPADNISIAKNELAVLGTISWT